MKIIKYIDDWALMECTLGHQFEVDPHTEENLYWNGKSLKSECPQCGEKDETP